MSSPFEPVNLLCACYIYVFLGVRSAHEVNGTRTFQMDTADRAAYPKASRVVRVGDAAAWTSEDSNFLEKSASLVRRRCKDLQPCEINTLLDPRPRVRHKNEHVYLLFGPRVICVDANNKTQMDIRELVFEPICESVAKDDLPEIPHSL